MDSNDLYIYGSVKTYTIYKNSGHLEFPRKHAAILDFVWVWPFFNYFPLSCVSLHNINSDAAYSAEETINIIKLLSLSIKSLL